MQNGIQSGEIVGDRYCILYEVGRGRWSRTYLAQDCKGKRKRCVLKVFAPAIQDSRTLQKATHLFEQEARIVSQLHHPQIPKLRAFFREPSNRQERWFCAYDCVKGLNYRELLQLRSQHGRSFSEREVIEFLQKLLPVFAYIHQRGATHGDLALDSVMLRQSDNLPVAIDFGTFKQVAAVVETSGKSKAFYAGKPGYAPIEQVQAGIVLPQSDLYALGATAIALLSGREPQHLIDPRSQTWNWQRVAATPALLEILQQILAREPSDRFPDATTVLAALQPLLGADFADTPSAEDLEEENTPTSGNLAEKEDPEDKEERSSNRLISPPTPPSPRPPVPPSPRPPLSTHPFQESKLKSPVPNAQRHPSPSPPLLNWTIALGKLVLVCLLSLSSGTVGWWAGKVWIDQHAQSQASEGEPVSPAPEALSFLPADDPEPDPPASLPATERERKLALRDRRLRSGIHYEFFTELVNTLFGSAYPTRARQMPSLAPEDARWRDRWDALAEELLDKLAFLSLPARQRLGRYDSQERSTAGQVAESLNLSRQAFFDLVDAQFAYRFPELASPENEPGAIASLERTPAIAQVWQAIAFDQLRAMRSSNALVQIALDLNSSGRPVAGTLQPGEGKVFLVRLESGQLVNAFLDAEAPSFFAIYNPNGDRVLEDTQLRTWSERVPQTGIYQFVLVSQSPVALEYNLNLTVVE